MSFLRRNTGGGITIPPRKVSFWDTVKEIIFFTGLYSLSGIVQLAIVAIVALLLGTLSGPAFLALVFVLEFKARILADVRPARIGLYFEHSYHGKEKPGHISLAQAILGIAGVLTIAAVLTDYFPVVWQWRVGWDGSGYIVLSRFSWDDAGQWYVATTAEVLSRVVLVFAIPFVGWVSSLLVKWAAKMEVVRPTFRESTYAVSDPGGVEGPTGEKFKSPARESGGGDSGGVVIVPAYD